MKLYPYYSKLPGWAVITSAALLSAAGTLRTARYKRGLYISFVGVGAHGAILAASTEWRKLPQSGLQLISQFGYPITSVRCVVTFYMQGVKVRSVSKKVPYAYTAGVLSYAHVLYGPRLDAVLQELTAGALR
jgi:hypothetical protein